MTLHVAIIGGGLAGPCLAHGLRRAGFGVSLYERDADRGQGYRIHLAPEGDQALRDCLPDHLYRLVHDTAGIPGSGVTVFDGELNVLNRIEGGGGLSVDRQTFRAILTTDLDDVLHQGAEFTRYEELPGGRVRAHFADGSTADADLLVGADGATSRVRRQLLPHARVDDLGIALVVGKARLTPEVRAVVPPQSLDGFSTVVGSGGRFMPLAGHQFRNRPAEYGLPDVPDYVMWALGLPGDVSGLDGAGLLDLALDRTSSWHPGLHVLLRRSDTTAIRATTLRTSHPVEPWPSGLVTLVGDAAHCMVPAGIGAAVALRDAGLLARRLTELPPVPAVHAYEAEMLEYGFAAVAAAQRVGRT